MDKLLTECIDASTPKMSGAIHGYAPEVMERLPMFLDERFRSGMGIIDDDIPIKYLGYRKVPPRETYEILLSKSGKTDIDIAVSSVYMMEYVFENDGQLIKKLLLLPYSERGNIMRISNTVYTVSFVLSDRVITVSDTGTFIRLLISKINILSLAKNILVDGVRIPAQIIYSVEIARVKILQDNIGKPVPPIALYLFAKFGIQGTFKKYFNFEEGDIEIINTELAESCERTKELIANKDAYTVYRTAGMRPRGHKDMSYLPHNTEVLVKKSVKVGSGAFNAIASIIYALDMLPRTAHDSAMVFNQEDEKEFWLLLLGRLIYKDAWSISRIMSDMTKHLSVLDKYLDEMAKKILIYDVEDFFELLALHLEMFNEWIITHKDISSDLKNKYVDLDYYMSYDIVYTFHNILLNLNRRNNKATGGISHSEVKKIFQELSYKKIYSLVKSAATNLTLTVGDYSGDLIYSKCTSKLEDQSRGTGVNRGSKSQFPASTRFIRGQDVYLGSFLHLGRKNPSPKFSANVFFEFDKFLGTMELPEDRMAVTRDLDAMLVGTVKPEELGIDIHDEVLTIEASYDDME